MIIEYHRPHTMDEALALLARTSPKTVPLGGGTRINRWTAEPTAVVDLQALPLKTIVTEGKQVEIGAGITLQELVENESLPPALREAAHREAGLNFRNAATLAGTLMTTDGRSALTAVLLAMDAHLVWLPGEKEIGLGEWLSARGQKQPGHLIAKIVFPAQVPVGLQTVARTPADLPIVVVVVAKFDLGRTRVVVGGFGAAPVLALDEVKPQNAANAVKKALNQASDEWAGAAYRQAAAEAMLERLLS
ncbi:MAG: FAD binding domain-containing protein [Anaerolineaceae bacterium]